MTPEQQAASDALGRAVLATVAARQALDAFGPGTMAFIVPEWSAAFDTWRDAYRAEAAARALLAATVQEVSGD